MKRKPVNKNYDKKKFSATAKKTKKINVKPSQWRGGICL